MRLPGFEEEWVLMKLGEVCEIKTGNKDTQNKVDDGIYPFFVRSNTVERINTYSYDGEAILTSGDGVGVGKNFHYIQGKFDFHQRVYALRNFKEGYSAKFLYNVFSQKFYDRVKKLSAKNSVDSVRMDMISGMKIYFPNVNEQKKIALFLSLVEDRIQTQNKIIEGLKLLKKTVSKKILNRDLTFKDEHGNKFHDWNKKKLKDIGEFYVGGDLDKLDYKKEKSPIYKYPIFANSSGDGLYGYANSYQYPKNSVTVSGRGNLGVANVRYEQFNAIVRLIVIIPVNGVNPKYLEESINHINFAVESTGVPQLTVPQIATYSIDVPCIEEQIRITNFLSSIDAKINVENRLLDKLKEQKKFLLQQMFI